MAQAWMIYGAYGYSGELIAREAVKQRMKPVLAGRSREKTEALANELGLESKVFSLDDPDMANHIEGMGVVLHCAGPFSATSAPMIEACLAKSAHYLDITGEISVFEHAHSLNQRAREAGVILCPGVGFDVIPTDCVAARLNEEMPDATHLTLAFHSSSGMSPGTAKTSVEGMGQGGKVRKDGKITTVPLGYRFRDIDFGDGPIKTVTIPWGDVSTAYHSTGIPNIETYMSIPDKMVGKMKMARYLRPVLALGPVQNYMKKNIEKKVKGPSERTRAKSPTHVFGEVRNAAGQVKSARVTTANGYDVTVTGSLAVTAWLLSHEPEPGAVTPSKLLGSGLVETLPGSTKITVS